MRTIGAETRSVRATTLNPLQAPSDRRVGTAVEVLLISPSAESWTVQAIVAVRLLDGKLHLSIPCVQVAVKIRTNLVRFMIFRSAWFMRVPRFSEALSGD